VHHVATAVVGSEELDHHARSAVGTEPRARHLGRRPCDVDGRLVDDFDIAAQAVAQRVERRAQVVRRHARRPSTHDHRPSRVRPDHGHATESGRGQGQDARVREQHGGVHGRLTCHHPVLGKVLGPGLFLRVVVQCPHTVEDGQEPHHGGIDL